MTTRRGATFAATLALVAIPLAARAQPGPASAKTADKDGRGGCFYVNQIQNDRPLGDRSVIFRVNVSDFYRMDFAQRCQELTYPEPKVILTPVGGFGLICKAIDVDVKVGDQGPGAFATPCIPSALYKMTPAEVAAVPKKDLP